MSGGGLVAGAVLHVRGVEPVAQPVRTEAGNLLVFNGEIFGAPGPVMERCGEVGDTTAVASFLDAACGAVKSPEELGEILAASLLELEGPFSLVYVHAATGSALLARDPMGRRSLVAFGLAGGLAVASVASPSDGPGLPLLAELSARAAATGLDEGAGGWTTGPVDLFPGAAWLVRREPGPADTGAHGDGVGWAPVADGIVALRASEKSGSRGWPTIPALDCPAGALGPPLASAAASASDGDEGASGPSAAASAAPLPSGSGPGRLSASGASLLAALRASVADRCRLLDTPALPLQILGALPSASDLVRGAAMSCEEARDGGAAAAPSRIGVLFSGGIDCTVVARLAHEALPPDDAIDLISVCFAAGGTRSPDRVSALESLGDLRRSCPSRRWRLLEADWPAAAVQEASPHLLRLLAPNDTVMDLSIGGAIWLAAQGVGWLHGSERPDGTRLLVRSQCRVLLSGQGADELLGGYARHTRAGSAADAAAALRSSLVEDQARLWRRNLGRDDRIVSDTGRELRAPFLARGVLRAVAGIPLDELVRPGLPRGQAEKAVLRVVAAHLGLPHSAAAPKRAVQFGSRLAKGLNKDRAAGKKSLGAAKASAVL